MIESERRLVALFLPSLRGGGAERVMVNLARGLVERGLKVDLVLAKAEGPYLSELPREVRVIDLGSRRVLSSLPALIHYLRRERPRAMLSTLSHANIVAIWARAVARVPVRLVVREANPPTLDARGASTIRGRLMPLLTRLFYQYADAVVANSQGVAADLRRVSRVPESKLRVIYNPVITSDLLARAEEDLDHPWFLPGEPPVVLGVGRLTQQKDFATLIRAFALVRKRQPVRLLILGEGEKRPELEALVHELGLDSDVALPGFVDNPFKYMRRAAVFVLSSRWEGLPNVLIQALALGTPLVSSDCPSGPAEILEGGKWGRLVPMGDAGKLAEAILAALATKAVRDAASSLEKFTLPRVTEEYLAVLALEDVDREGGTWKQP